MNSVIGVCLSLSAMATNCPTEFLYLATSIASIEYNLTPSLTYSKIVKQLAIGKQSVKYNFLLIAHEYLFVFKKA